MGTSAHRLAASALALGLPLAVAAWPAQAGQVRVDHDASTIEVMTLNTWGLPAPVSSARRSRFPQIAAFVEQSGVDLVGLQEVWKSAVGLLILDGLRLPEDRSTDSGLALVTQHRVDSLQVHAFTAARGIDRLKGKGVLHAQVELPDAGRVEVFVTHLQAGGSDKNARVRAAQVDELLGWAGAAEGPTIVMGDFNLYEQNPIDVASWDRLQAAGLVDAAAQLDATQATYVGQAHRFDHIYVRSGSAVQVAADRAEVVDYDDDPDTSNPPVLSDHRPVRVRMTVTRRALAER